METTVPEFSHADKFVCGFLCENQPGYKIFRSHVLSLSILSMLFHFLMA